MCKKIWIAGAAVLVGLAVLAGADATGLKPNRLGSLLCLKWKKTGDWARNQVSPETEIERLRVEVARLGNVSKSHYRQLAEEDVAVGNLRQEITVLEGNLARQKKNVLALKEDLASAEEYVVYGGQKYSKEQVKKQLARDFEAFKVAEENLKAKRSLLEAKQASLDSAREQVKAMQDARQMLEDKLARLEAEVKKVRVSQTKSELVLDDSELSRVKGDVAELENRVKVMQKELEINAEYSHAPIPLTERVKEEDLVKDIDEHFGTKKVADQK